VLSLAVMAPPTFAAGEGDKVTEEFHKTYPLSATGRVSLGNINGAVHITGWDRNEVRVDAIKRAQSKQRLDEARIEVDATANSISIRTEYPNRSWKSDEWDPPASVEYSLSVPRGARLEKIELINGGLDIRDVTGEVEAACINGPLVAERLGGKTRLSTVNGRLEAQVERLSTTPLELSSVNGSLRLTLPSDAKANLAASTVHGSISNDFGLRVNNHRWVGHDLNGELGGGGSAILLSNVNGPIEIRQANDRKKKSTVKDRSPDSDGGDLI
jgi:DUF4097 and DUF4098 domain-containing protein YvlB